MSKLQVGDIVRYKRNEPLMLSIPKGSVGIIESKTTHGYACVNFNLKPTVQTGDLEYMGNQDPKTAFLTELKELMEKYGVEIDCGGEDPISDKWLKFIFSDGIITYDNEFRRNHKYFPFPITPSNIFDYDK